MVAMSSDPGPRFLGDDERWEPIEELGPGTLWTDDFSDILSVIRYVRTPVALGILGRP